MFVRREQECCPFLGFIIREDRDALILVIEAPKTPAKPPTPYSGPTPQQGIPVKSLVGIHSGASVGGELIPTPHRRAGCNTPLPSIVAATTLFGLPSSTPQNAASVWLADFGRTAAGTGVRRSQPRVPVNRLGQLEDLLGQIQ